MTRSSRIRLVAIAALLLAVTPAVPGAEFTARVDCPPNGCPTDTLHPAVARVVNDMGRGRVYGSGSLVHKDAEQGIVLTCAHLFREAVGHVTVTFPDGHPRYAALVDVDRTWDLALLKIAPPPVEPLAIAAEPPRPGEPLTSCGYGREGDYWCNQGRALGYMKPGQATPADTLVLSGFARDGDSGGPVLNRQGELVAVLWGTDGRTVCGTYCGRLRRFLGRIISTIRPSRRPGPLPGPGPGRPESQGPSPDTAMPPLVPVAPIEAAMESLAGRVDEFSGRVEQLVQAGRRQGEAIRAISGRVDELANLPTKIVQSDTFRESVRSTVRESAAAAPDVAGKLMPWILASLGLGGLTPAAFAAWGLVRVLRKRTSNFEQHRVDAQDPTPQEPRRRPLNDDYAEQLARVYELSGRSPTADATLGRVYDQELRNAETSSDTTLAVWAKKLRQRVASQFYRIHDDRPSPASPIKAAG